MTFNNKAKESISLIDDKIDKYYNTVKANDDLMIIVNSNMKNLIKKCHNLLRLVQKIDSIFVVEDMVKNEEDLLKFKINQLKDVWPLFVACIDKEYEFKKDALRDFSYNIDNHTDIAILSSWKHYVYIDYSLINKLYSIVV
uniref:Uncharacterized protein n=1 Tax=Parastrongyloides trichosuri TaxID=131310 RepID=A0A0N4Z760_PARTI